MCDNKRRGRRNAANVLRPLDQHTTVEKDVLAVAHIVPPSPPRRSKWSTGFIELEPSLIDHPLIDSLSDAAHRSRKGARI